MGSNNSVSTVSTVFTAMQQNQTICICEKILPIGDCSNCWMKQCEKTYLQHCEKMYPDDKIGSDGMYDKQRREYFIEKCKELNVTTIIGESEKFMLDRPQTLSLRVQIPNRPNEISCLFSHHAFYGYNIGNIKRCGHLIEVSTHFSREECDILSINGEKYFEYTSSVTCIPSYSADTLIIFIALLCEMYTNV